ncbi:MAG: hypothetical protein DRQ62_00970 [Gammaproteobacteria bacterium]|nr:MAG: hypothetical protein DRQ62_00970 [Gammaproteobacteria bacterium]
MKAKIIQKCLLSMQLLGFSMAVLSSPIYYQVTEISGNTYEYQYTVGNQSAADIEEFTIYFDLGLYENLLLTASPADWDSIVDQPDPSIPDDGYFDSLALTTGISPDGSLSGFSVQFDYLGTGTPGSQFFEIIDPISFQPISDDYTQPLPVENVPEPPVFVLLAFGLFLISCYRRTRQNHQI